MAATIVKAGGGCNATSSQEPAGVSRTLARDGSRHVQLESTLRIPDRIATGVETQVENGHGAIEVVGANQLDQKAVANVAAVILILCVKMLTSAYARSGNGSSIFYDGALIGALLSALALGILVFGGAGHFNTRILVSIAAFSAMLAFLDYLIPTW